MRTLALVLVTCSLFLLGSCRTYVSSGGQRESLLLRTVDTDEGELSYSLYSSGRSVPKIHRTETVQVERAQLGIVARTLGIEAAEARGLEPWRGVVLDRVNSGSAAEESGLKRGDVLLRLGETDLTSRDQLVELVELELRPDQSVPATVLRKIEGQEERQRIELDLVPEAAIEENRSTDPIELPTSQLVRWLTGMQVGEVEGDLAREAFQLEGPLVVIGNVKTGSPAYHAGLRFGDRIEVCNGQPLRSVDQLHQAVLARALKKGLRLRGLEEAGLGGTSQELPEQADGPLDLEVQGPLGPHRAEVELNDDLDEVTSFDIPILLDYRSDVRRKRVSFLDFIFQFGFNYSRSYQPSESRSTARSSYLSLLPFGMFRFKSTPESSSQTYFWFITFKRRP